MQVREVLKSKGGRVVTIDPKATIAEAVARLVQNNIGSLPVVDADDRLIGVISERDVLRHVHNRGESYAKQCVEDIMTCNPVTCTPACDVDDVMGQMSSRRIAKVPVIDEGRLVGIVSVGDVIKVMYEQLHAENTHLISYLYGHT
jgi:CBS domain-containing protein